MLPADRIIAAALKAAIDAYAADETAFRAVFQGWPTAEIDALWSDYQSADQRPAVRMEYTRRPVKVPLFLVYAPQDNTEGAPAGGVDTDHYYTLGNMVSVAVVGKTPDDVALLGQFARACVLVSNEAILRARVGCGGVHYRGSTETIPVEIEGAPGGGPELLYTRMLNFEVKETLSLPATAVPTALDPTGLIDSLTIVREGYTTTVEGTDIDGTVGYDRADD